MEGNIYYDRCMDFLARMIEKYGGEVPLPNGVVNPTSATADAETESTPSQFTYWFALQKNRHGREPIPCRAGFLDNHMTYSPSSLIMPSTSLPP